jgi:hypothetical protein
MCVGMKRGRVAHAGVKLQCGQHQQVGKARAFDEHAKGQKIVSFEGRTSRYGDRDEMGKEYPTSDVGSEQESSLACDSLWVDDVAQGDGGVNPGNVKSL